VTPRARRRWRLRAEELFRGPAVATLKAAQAKAERKYKRIPRFFQHEFGAGSQQLPSGGGRGDAACGGLL